MLFSFKKYDMRSRRNFLKIFACAFTVSSFLSLLFIDKSALSAPKDELSQTEIHEMQKLTITVGNTKFIATMANNSSAKALMELLSKNPLTIQMKDYGGFEKVGSLGQDLPTNDEQITTGAGDLILYQGKHFVIYYATNSWNLTRLGKINNATGDELKTALGNGNVTVTLSIN